VYVGSNPSRSFPVHEHELKKAKYFTTPQHFNVYNFQDEDLDVFSDFLDYLYSNSHVNFSIPRYELDLDQYRTAFLRFVKLYLFGRNIDMDEVRNFCIDHIHKSLSRGTLPPAKTFQIILEATAKDTNDKLRLLLQQFLHGHDTQARLGSNIGALTLDSHSEYSKMKTYL
jgi:hypothetical protein